MAQIKFQAPRSSDAAIANLLKGIMQAPTATESIIAPLEEFTQSIERRKQGQRERQRSSNMGDIRADFESIDTLADFRKAENEGIIGLTAANKLYPNAFNKAEYQKIQSEQEKKLQDEAHNISMQEGIAATKSSRDPVAGQTAYYDAFTRLGGSPTRATAGVQQFSQATQFLSKGFAVADKKQMDTLVADSLIRVMNNESPDAVRAEIAKTLPGDQSTAYVKQFQSELDARTNMSKEDLEISDQSYRQVVGHNSIALKQSTERMNNIQRQIKQIESFAIAPGTAEFILGKSTAGEAPLDAAGASLEKGGWNGFLDGAFGFFDDKTTGTAAKNYLIAKKNKLAERYGEAKAAAIVYQAYLNTKDDGQTWLGSQALHTRKFSESVTSIAQKEKQMQSLREQLIKGKTQHIKLTQDISTDNSQAFLEINKQIRKQNLTGEKVNIPALIKKYQTGPIQSFTPSKYNLDNTFSNIGNQTITETQTVNPKDKIPPKASMWDNIKKLVR